jgi:hypothetical protein
MTKTPVLYRKSIFHLPPHIRAPFPLGPLSSFLCFVEAVGIEPRNSCMQYSTPELLPQPLFPKSYTNVYVYGKLTGRD